MTASILDPLKQFAREGAPRKVCKFDVRLSNLAPIGTKLRENAFRTICNFRFFDAEKFFSENFSQNFFGFSWFSADFGPIFNFSTSKSASTSNFASDTPFLRSVRPKIGVSSSSNTRSVLPRTQGTSFFEHKECLFSNTRKFSAVLCALAFRQCNKRNTARYRRDVRMLRS